MNPESESRAALVRRLRESADKLVDMQEVPPVRRDAAIDLRQAANEIEDLSKKTNGQTVELAHRLRHDLETVINNFLARETTYYPLVKTTFDVNEPWVFKLSADTRPLQVFIEVRMLRRPNA